LQAVVRIGKTAILKSPAMRISFVFFSHYLRLPLVSLLFVALISCSPLPRYNNKYDPTTNFSTYRTYAFYKAEIPPPREGSGSAYSIILDQHLKAAIESELVKIGMRPSEEEPDLLIAYDIAIPAESSAEAGNIFAPGFGYSYSYWFGYRYRYAHRAIADYKPVNTYTTGTLLIDIIDARSNELIWRGWAEKAIDPTTTDNYNIATAVAAIMPGFPPLGR
jgi:hypothetical protein